MTQLSVFLYDIPDGQSADFGFGYTQDTWVMSFYMTPSWAAGSSVQVDTSLVAGATGSYTIVGQEQQGFESGETINISIPPGTEPVQIIFDLAQADFDPDDPTNPDLMGRLTFSNVNLPSNTVTGDLIHFGASDGVRRVISDQAAAGLFPVYGDTAANAVESAIKQNSNLHIGTE